MDWSCGNEMVVSAGVDGTVCLWSASNGKLLRQVKDQSSSQVLCCAFHPLNTNWLVVSFTLSNIKESVILLAFLLPKHLVFDSSVCKLHLMLDTELFNKYFLCSI